MFQSLAPWGEKSRAQLDAEEKGDEHTTIKYLNKNPLIVILVFTFAIMVSQVWFATIRVFLESYVFKTSQMSMMQWLGLSIVVTIVVLFSFRFVFKVPITAAFTL